MIHLRFKPNNAQANKAASEQRWKSAWAVEEWNIDPLWKMSVPDFLAHLTALYGPLYLEDVDFERTADGRLLPVHTCEGRIRSLFRRHPEGLTRLQVRRILGLGYGVVQRIVTPPAYVVVGAAKAAQGYANLWAQNKSPVT